MDKDGQSSLDTGAVRSALRLGDYPEVIAEVRAAVAADPMAALGDPVINDWMGRRFRNIFLDEALVHPDTVKHSRAPFPLRLVDPRSERERVARRMLRDIADDEITSEMPAARAGSLSETTLVFAPGLLTGLLPSLAFQSVWPTMKERFGIRILAVDAHPMRGSEGNVADLENALEHGIGVDSDPDGSFITADDNPTPPGDVILMGYSKGSPDILTLLARRPDLAPRIKAFIGWAGAVGGSYIANDIYDKIKDVQAFEVIKDMTGKIGELMLRLAPIVDVHKIDRRLDEYDIKGAVLSLTTPYRDQFLAENSDRINELGIPMFYFSGSTSLFEVPYFQRQGTLELDHYDQENDMQLTQAQARPPLTTAPHLAKFHANHWDLSYDAFPWYKTLGSTKLTDPFGREPAMAAIILFMAELGLLN